MKALFLPLFLLLNTAPAFADEVSGKGIAIADGDTLTVLSADQQPIKIRLTHASRAFRNRSILSATDPRISAPLVIPPPTTPPATRKGQNCCGSRKNINLQRYNAIRLLNGGTERWRRPFRVFQAVRFAHGD